MSRPDPDTELAMLVRDAAPRPSAEFLEGLDTRVGERFGRPARERRAWLSWPRLVPALGACAVLIAVVAIAVGQSGGGSDESAKPFTPPAAQTPLDDGGSAAAKGAATESAAPAPARQARGGSTTAATPSAVPVPPPPHRRVIRDTQLALLSPLREF